jgi:hypothetical protein
LPAASGQRWEYAQLQTGITTNAFVFSTADFYAAAGSAADLLTKLGGKSATVDEQMKDPSLNAKTYISLLSQIGAAGWELVSVTPDGNWGPEKLDANYSRVFLFKRLSPK